MKFENWGVASDEARKGREKIDAIGSTEMIARGEIWNEGIAALCRAFEALKNGIKKTSKYHSWKEALMKEIETDPLLSYLYAARSAKEHGRGNGVAEIAEIQGTRPRGPTDPILTSVGVELRTGEHVTQDFAPNDHWIVSGLPVLTLVPVPGDRKVEVPVPTTHLGKSIENSDPAGVAYLALEYLEVKVKEAFYMHEEDEPNGS